LIQVYVLIKLFWLHSYNHDDALRSLNWFTFTVTFMLLENTHTHTHKKTLLNQNYLVLHSCFKRLFHTAAYSGQEHT